jgi:peroxiredoxin
MSVPKKAFYFAFALIGVTGLWLATAKPDVQADELILGPQPGFLAPDFSLQTLDGEFVTLSEFRGQPVLVNMWASWCTPCKYEMPAIQEAYEEFRDQGFTVLAVNLTKKDVLGSVESFVEEHGLTFPILLDQDGRVEDAYQLRGLPTSFFIDRDGVIQSVVIGGPMSQEAIRSFVQKLIDEE